MISNLYDVTPNVWFGTECALSHVQYLLWYMYGTSHQSSMRVRRSAISPMRPHICGARISRPDKEQEYRKPILNNQGLRGYANIDMTYRMCCIPVG